MPQSASSGQTRSIDVGISNARYPETVQVQLYRDDTLHRDAHAVGAGTDRRPDDLVRLHLHVHGDDAALGKVTFEAVATLVGARDALLSDNTAIALPTKVSK